MSVDAGALGSAVQVNRDFNASSAAVPQSYFGSAMDMAPAVGNFLANATEKGLDFLGDHPDFAKLLIAGVTFLSVFGLGSKLGLGFGEKGGIIRGMIGAAGSFAAADGISQVATEALVEARQEELKNGVFTP